MGGASLAAGRDRWRELPHVLVGDDVHAMVERPVLAWLTLLGRWQMLRATRPGSMPVPVPVPRNGQRLVAFLALSGARERDYVTGQLWPDSTESRAHANLRTALWRLRRTGAGVIDASHGELVLRGIRTDVADLTRYARRLLDNPQAPVDPGAVRRLGGPGLLPGWYEDWVQEERDRLDRLRIRTLEVVSDRLLAGGRAALAAEAARAAIRLDPFREHARRSLIRAQLADADIAGAVREYGQFRDLLAQELQVLPSGRITALLGSYLPRR